MARKNGLNRKEQLQCAKGLAEKIPAEDIAKKFGTSVSIVRRFTQKALDEASKKADERTTKQGKVVKQRRSTAAILKEVIDSDKEDSDFS